MDTLTVKIQRPLYPDDAPCLITSRDKAFVMMYNMTKAEMDKIFGGALRVYYKTRYKNGNIELIEQVPNEEW